MVGGQKEDGKEKEKGQQDHPSGQIKGGNNIVKVVDWLRGPGDKHKLEEVPRTNIIKLLAESRPDHSGNNKCPIFRYLQNKIFFCRMFLLALDSYIIQGPNPLFPLGVESPAAEPDHGSEGQLPGELDEEEEAEAGRGLAAGQPGQDNAGRDPRVLPGHPLTP